MDASMLKDTVGGVAVSQTETREPELDVAGPDDPDFFGGDGPSSCMWSDGFCSEIAEYYIMEYCNDPDCKYDHATRYCPRHFVIALGQKLDHLKVCPGMRKAKTPDEIRQVAFQHIPSFGPLSKDPDRPRACGGSGAGPAIAPEAGKAQMDEVIDKLQVTFCRGAYDDLRMSEHTTADDLRSWLDGLELKHLNLSVELFTAGAEPLKLLELRYESERENPYSMGLYNPDEDEGWSPSAAASLERRDLIAPKLSTRVDENDRLVNYYMVDAMMATPLRDLGRLTLDSERAQPGLFAIVEQRTNAVIPVTAGSWLQWKAMYDGDENELTVCDDASFRRNMAPYLEYFDTTKELNPVKVRAKIAELTARANHVLNDGVRPE